MYVKYVIGSSSTAAETARDILNIILGNYTSLSDLQAEGTGTTIEGTGPIILLFLKNMYNIQP